MNITITTDSGVHVSAPTEKWVCALVVALSDISPELAAKVFHLVDNKTEAFAHKPDSVQQSLTRPGMNIPLIGYGSVPLIGSGEEIL